LFLLNVEELLKLCVEMDGSDLHLKTDTGRVLVRVYGELRDIDTDHFTERDFMTAMKSLLRESQLKRFEETMELDFALEVPGISRFRGNMFRQRGVPQAIFRVIPFHIQTMDELHLPELCYELIERPRGLVLVTGPAGSGKSTTLASMIDAVNRSLPVHIVTVEDPVEFVHDDHVALVNQREIDVDTNSFANALKYVLRQDPDVILVGEMRDLETIHLAITAAETGHLVFGTLHTVDAIQTVDRIVDVFPQHQQQQIRMQLSVNLLGVISQTLVPRKDNRGRVAAFEVLNCNSAVRNLVRENKTYQISSIIQTGAKQHMQTLDQGLARLVERGLVDVNVAKGRAKDAGEFMRIVALTANNAGAKKTTVEKPIERHIFVHEPEVIHVQHDDDAALTAAQGTQEDRMLVEAASEPEPNLVKMVIEESQDGSLDALDQGYLSRDPADAAPAEETAPVQTPAPAQGTASRRAVQGSYASPSPASTGITSSPNPVQSPAPAGQPSSMVQETSPSTGYGSPFDPLSEGGPKRLIDPPTRPSMPKIEKPKKKGFFSAIFGSRD
jgi:twitching motility protein PilT